MSWRTFVIDGPAALVTLWWLAYRVVLMALIMIVVTLTALSLVLDSLGYRWGW